MFPALPAIQILWKVILTEATFRGSEFTLAWEKCEQDIIAEEATCATKEVRKRKVFMKLEDCSLTCGGDRNTSQVKNKYTIMC